LLSNPGDDLNPKHQPLVTMLTEVGSGMLARICD
jgi:hypothetical protein